MTTPLRWSFELVDLSRPLSVDTVDALFGDLVAEGKNPYFRDIRIETVIDHDETTARSCLLTIPDHVATHVDAPIHAVAGGGSLEDVDLRRLIGEAVVLDLRRDGGHGYTADDFEDVGGDIREGDIVLVYSGFRDALPTEPMTQTHLEPSAARWLVDRGVHAVGVEPASPDPLVAGLYEYGWMAKDAPTPPWPAHRILLESDVYIIEGLVNLERLAGQRVRFAALPALVPGLTGFPVRAVAWIDENPTETGER